MSREGRGSGRRSTGSCVGGGKVQAWQRQMGGKRVWRKRVKKG